MLSFARDGTISSIADCSEPAHSLGRSFQPGEQTVTSLTGVPARLSQISLSYRVRARQTDANACDPAIAAVRVDRVDARADRCMPHSTRRARPPTSRACLSYLSVGRSPCGCTSARLLMLDIACMSYTCGPRLYTSAHSSTLVLHTWPPAE